MPNLEKSAPGGRDGAQENFAKPGHGANAQQNNLTPNAGAHSFKQGD